MVAVRKLSAALFALRICGDHTYGGFLFITILIIMISNKNLNSETPVTLQDVLYQSSVRIRTMFINGEPWFVANDVCELLEFANPRDAYSRLDDFEKGVGNVDTLGGVQQMNIVNESGLYHLCFISRKAEAKVFRQWVTQTLLPTLRKTGRYEIDKPKRKRLLPRDRKDIDPSFFTELRKYVLPENLRDTAAELALTLRHVQKVLNGTAVSYRVMEQLVRIGMQNRENGIFRKEQKPYQPLIFLFSEAELNGEEA